MKILFLFLLLAHGLIHILGFLKSFDILETTQLTQDISRALGILWLGSSIMFLAVIILYFLNKDWWWAPAIFTVVLSQILIFLSWPDAKFGTIPNVIILFVIIIGFASWQFNQTTDKQVKQILSETSEATIITQNMLTPLPIPVQNWLKKIGIIGRERIDAVYLKQQGRMRLKPEQKKWTIAEAEQYVTTEKPAFLWKVHMKMPPFSVESRDMYQNGEGQMVIKLLSLFPVVNISHNEKTNQSILQRYLLELPLYPSAALEPYIEWESIDPYTAKATMTYKGVSGSATYFFNISGDLEKVSAFRYKENDEKAEPIECIGEMIETTEIDGVEIPTKIDISWMLDEGKFTWYKLEIYNYKMNRFSI